MSVPVLTIPPYFLVEVASDKPRAKCAPDGGVLWLYLKHTRLESSLPGSGVWPDVSRLTPMSQLGGWGSSRSAFSAIDNKQRDCPLTAVSLQLACPLMRSPFTKGEWHVRGRYQPFRGCRDHFRGRWMLMRGEGVVSLCFSRSTYENRNLGSYTSWKYLDFLYMLGPG